MRLIDLLTEYSRGGVSPFHMPGHKRSADADYLRRLGGDIDITEISGMDNLHGADGVLKDCMKRASRLWHSRHTFFLVNGSTCGNLAGIRAAARHGDSVIMARNCHKSVYNGVELCGLNPTYICPERLEKFNISGGVTPGQVEAAFAKAPHAKLVIVTSPTYEGVISDIRGICETAHRHGAAVLVDEAHGSHLDLTCHFTGGAVNAGADIVVQSLHKTLPSLTQTAVMHVNGDIISADEVGRQLAVFETSSPSYLLMSSIDACTALISEKKAELFDTWSNNLDEIYGKLSDLKHFRLLSSENAPEMFAFDRSKLVIYTGGTSVSGKELFMKLNEAGVECEMAAPDYIIAMTSAFDSGEAIEKLCRTVIGADAEAVLRDEEHDTVTDSPEQVMSPLTAVMQRHGTVDFEHAVGSVSAEYIWAYPPGIPLAVPGEMITSGLLTQLEYYRKRGIDLHFSHSHGEDEAEIVLGY